MPSRIWAFGAGGVAIVGAAVAGGYFVGHLNNPQPPPPQTTQAPAAQPAEPYPQESEQGPASETQANYPPGYSRSVYSPWTNRSSERSARHRPHHVSFQYFRDSLSPYGHWMHNDRWGEVWQPTQVESDFRPYERGHWANTQEFGWTWASDYEWGDIAFHYGRWVDDPERGWLWVPGYVWGPGWVVWRTGSHHTGWMPMPPDEHFLRGEENERVDWSRERDDYGYRDWYGSYYDQDRLDSHWVYVDTGHFADPDYRRYEVRRPWEIHQLNIQTHDATNYVTVDNFIVNRSVDPRVVEQQSGRRVEAVPATRVIAKPELVAPVNAGTQIAIATHQDIPAGTGKPHSAPPSNPVALNAPPPPANAPLPQAPANAPGTGNMTTAPGPANAPMKPAEQKPSGSASTNAASNAPPSAPTTNVQQAQQPGAPNNEPMAKRHRGAPGFAEQPSQPQPPAVPPNAPSKPPSAMATTQPSAPQEQAQQPSAPATAREEKHRRGAPSAMQQGGPQGAAQSAQTSPSTPTSAPPSQQAQQPSASGTQSASGPGGERFFTRHGNRGRKEAEQGTEANAPAAPSAAENNGASPAGQAASQSQQPSPAQEQERKAKREERKGEVVPSSLPPGSPSPYAQSPNGKSNAGGEGAAQDQSGSDQKHKKHREKGENPDEGGSPEQQQQ